MLLMIIHRPSSSHRFSRKIIASRLLVAGIALLLGCVGGCESKVSPQEDIVVFSATSLQSPMEEIARKFQEDHGAKIRLNFAASGSLAQQIQAGAKADMFVSASQRWIDNLASHGYAEPTQVEQLVSNSMVIVANRSSDWELSSIDRLSDLPFRYLVVGDPDFIPAGRYAKQFLESMIEPESKLSVWDSLSGRICPTSDLQRVLALVESDPSLIGMVYATDALRSKRAKVIHQISPANVVVNYFCVPTQVSKTASPASPYLTNPCLTDFLQYLRSDSGTRIFEQFGFQAANESRPR